MGERQARRGSDTPSQWNMPEQPKDSPSRPALDYLRKYSKYRAPGPAMLWVLVDEDVNGLNDAAFAFGMEAPFWFDAPGTYHNGGCGFAFADGHSESHHWKAPLPSRPTQAWLTPAITRIGSGCASAPPPTSLARCRRRNERLRSQHGFASPRASFILVRGRSVQICLTQHRPSALRSRCHCLI